MNEDNRKEIVTRQSQVEKQEQQEVFGIFTLGVILYEIRRKRKQFA